MSFINNSDLEQRLLARLDPLEGEHSPLHNSDFDLDKGWRPPPAPLTPAAVLAPIVRRPSGWTFLFIVRTQTMPTHAGQVAFPGGRVQAEDSGPVDTAVRETMEEVGLERRFIQPVGRFGAYQTGTGYAITPVVAFVEPGFTLNPDPREVDAVFEAPLDFLLNPFNHQQHQREYQGRLRTYYAMPYQDYYIWGATAGMIRALYERLYG